MMALLLKMLTAALSLMHLHNTHAVMLCVWPLQDIKLFINSPGGSVTAGMGIYDAMQVP